MVAEREMQHIGASKGAENHDLIHELSKRLDALWRYDQSIANSKETPICKSFGAS